MLRSTLLVLLLVQAILLCGCASLDAQPASLRDRIALLKRGEAPVTSETYSQTVLTVRDWGDELTAKGLFLAQQDLNLSFVRIPDFGEDATRNVRDWTRVLSFIEDNAGKLGSVVRLDRNKLIAGRSGTVVLEYTVGDVPINAGGLLILGQNFFNNRPRLQIDDPVGDNFVSFETSSKSAQVQTAASPLFGMYASIFVPVPMPSLRVVKGSLNKGDKVTVRIGDRRRGSAGYRTGWRDAESFQFLLSAAFSDASVLVPLAVSGVRILGDHAVSANAIVPSVVAPNEPFSLRLRLEDQYGNPAEFEGDDFTVSVNRQPLGVIAVKPGEYTGRLDNLRIYAVGGYKLEVTSASGLFRAVSNPILVESTPAQRIYWGELHGHSALDEGTGSAPRYYEFARDVAFLDFASLTGHDLFMSRTGWETVRSETEKANRNGSFVAYMGYEWTQRFRFGGHHNVFFKTDRGKYITRWDAPRPDQLYAKLRASDNVDNILIIPHAHEPGDWNFNDPQMERLVEIFSMHGSFEYFGRRYLKRGHRVGLIAASDDHTGHPGYSPAIISTRNGLAAVYSPSLDRDGIWRGMKERATYATSNATRPVVRLTVNGKLPGQATAVNEVPGFDARVLGTAAIDHIDIIHNGEVAYRRDYLTPSAGDRTALQVMLHSATETRGDEVASPLGGTGWGGWIEVEGARITSIQPLNVDHVTDQFHQVDSQRVWFSCRTRGDFDGVLLNLDSAPADARVKVIVSNLIGSAGGTGASGTVTWAGGPPPREPIHQASFVLRDVMSKAGESPVGENGRIYTRLVRAAGDWDVSFSYRPTQPPEQDDYFYLRAVQIDGEVAWVSPIWIGEKR